jgi:O-antigen/teichoic acid export membrane protein
LWNTLYQIFHVLLSFGAMLVLVRIIPVAEYGRAGVVLGWLLLLNTVNCGVFMAYALQEPESTEPDWSLHWTVGFYVQMTLSATCHLVAGVCWFIPTYQSLAPLMHIAALGLLLEWPSQLAMVMLQRDLAFQRLRLVLTYSAVLKVVTTVGLGLVGYGAVALVWGAHVVAALPPTIDLLLVRCWRPRPGWWRSVPWSAYRHAWHFGLHQIGSGFLYAARSGLEATVLPGLFGFTALGLLGRAQSLFGITIGRVGSIIIETVYPLLPRSAADLQQYRRQAATFVQATLLVTIPGALFLGIEGAAVSRLLYGETWHAIDPLLWPGALFGLGTVVFMLGTSVLEAAGRIRTSLWLSGVSAGIGIPVTAVAWLHGDLGTYAWAVAIGQLLSSSIALFAASAFFVPGWIRSVLVPPLLSSALAMGVTLLVARLGTEVPLVARLLFTTSVYIGVTIVVLRLVFPTALLAIVNRLPVSILDKGWGKLLGASRGVS